MSFSVSPVRQLALACGGVLSLLTSVVTTVSYAQTISTFAGNGLRGTPTDNVAATASTVDGANGIARDRFGNVYIADSNNHRIRKVSLDGVITTVAGTGVQGFGGENVPASTALLNYPTSVAIGANGDIFFADYGNNRIRRVSSSGSISTFAGTGTPGYSGDGGAATAAQLNKPIGVAIDATGNLIIADTQNQRIRRVNAAGVINTIAGNGVGGYGGDAGPATAAQLNFPGGLLPRTDGSLLIADYGNARIRKVDAAGVITTFAGSGVAGASGDGAAATAAQLSGPFALASGSNGSVLIADQINGRIRRVTADGNIATVAGGGSSFVLGDGASALSAFLASPSGVVSNAAGEIFISDRGNLRVRKVSSVVRELAEYRYAPSDYYFYTSKDAEKLLLDKTAGWSRTGAVILVNAANDAGTKAIVRYYFDQAAQNQTRGLHFYTLLDAEIATLNALNPTNARVPRLPFSEGTEAYAFPPVNGACNSAQTPVYRAFRNSAVAPDNATHRFTTDLASYNALVAAGWSAEGIVFCTASAP